VIIRRDGGWVPTLRDPCKGDTMRTMGQIVNAMRDIMPGRQARLGSCGSRRPGVCGGGVVDRLVELGLPLTQTTAERRPMRKGLSLLERRTTGCSRDLLSRGSRHRPR
jgi:hypothetical protein